MPTEYESGERLYTKEEYDKQTAIIKEMTEKMEKMDKKMEKNIRKVNFIYARERKLQEIGDHMMVCFSLLWTTSYILTSDTVIDHITPIYSPLNHWLQTTRIIATFISMLSIMACGKKQWRLQKEFEFEENEWFDEDETLARVRRRPRNTGRFFKSCVIWSALALSFTNLGLVFYRFLKQQSNGTSRIPPNSTQAIELMTQLLI